MPKRNIVKIYGEDQLYHLYNRGVAKMDIFRDNGDFEYMLGLLKKYLSPEKTRDSLRRKVPNYSGDAELVAYCLMPNHYHFLVYLKQKEGIEKLMRSVMTSYSMYFNKKYKRVGGLFESRYLASRISSDTYWRHISRYIHLNPIDLSVDYLNYPYSSIGYYIGNKRAEWISPERIREHHSIEKYRAFMQDYESIHDDHKRLKRELAHL